MYEFPFTDLNRKMIGFDRLFDEIVRQYKNRDVENYPPHNIVRLDQNKFLIELAVAGFTESDISIQLQDQVLTISGAGNKPKENDIQYMHRGIASRSFNKSFTLGDNVKVTGAELELGVLHVHLEKEIPEEQRPKQIPISKKTRGDPQLLMENKEKVA